MLAKKTTIFYFSLAKYVDSADFNNWKNKKYL